MLRMDIWNVADFFSAGKALQNDAKPGTMITFIQI